MKNLDQHAEEIAALMVRAGILAKEEIHRAEALLGVSLNERIGPLLEVEIHAKNNMDRCRDDCPRHLARIA